MARLRLTGLLIVFLVWGQHMSIELLPYNGNAERIGFGMILTAFSSIAWLFGAWFLRLGHLSGNTEGQRFVKLLVLFAPMYVVVLPLIGLKMFSYEWAVLSVFSALINFRPEKLHEIVWQFKKGWRAELPDNGKIPLYEYRKIYRQMIAIYIALPLAGGLVLPLLFRNSG